MLVLDVDFQPSLTLESRTGFPCDLCTTVLSIAAHRFVLCLKWCWDYAQRSARCKDLAAVYTATIGKWFTGTI